MPADRRRGLRLIEWLIILGIILAICAIAIPGLLSSQRASNERNASTSLKTLSSAEADFRANDRDWNHVNDFWTGDVKGLYTMTSAAEKGAGTSPKDPMEPKDPAERALKRCQDAGRTGCALYAVDNNVVFVKPAEPVAQAQQP